MPFHPDSLSLETVKNFADRLVKSQRNKNPLNRMKQSEAQEAVAFMLGFKHWHDLHQTLTESGKKKENPMVEMPTFSNPINRSYNRKLVVNKVFGSDRPHPAARWFMLQSFDSLIQSSTNPALITEIMVSRILEFPASDGSLMWNGRAISLLSGLTDWITNFASDSQDPKDGSIVTKSLPGLIDLLTSPEKLLAAGQQSKAVMAYLRSLPGGIQSEAGFEQHGYLQGIILHHFRDTRPMGKALNLNVVDVGGQEINQQLNDLAFGLHCQSVLSSKKDKTLLLLNGLTQEENKKLLENMGTSCIEKIDIQMFNVSEEK